jgi:hypothetical protein
MKLRYSLLPVVAACASLAALAQGPFDGTWTLNLAKSQLAGDIMRFAPASNGMIRYSDSEQSYTFKPDGTPFQTPSGRERTIKKTGDNTYETTSKKNGTLLSTSSWTISEDGKTLSIDVKGTKPNGDSFEDTSTYVRIAPGKGILGAWKSREVKISSPNTLTISSDKSGVTFTISAIKASCAAKWDGKDYPASGPTVGNGITLAFTKTGPRSFKLVEKLHGKVINIGRYTLSAD